MIRAFSLRGWLLILYAVLVIVACLLLLSWCSRGEKLKTVEAQRTIADSRTASASDAITAIGENAAGNTAIQDEVKDAQEDIRAATAGPDRERVARCRLRDLQGLPPC